MKILFVHPRIFAGGAEKAILHLAYQLKRLGHEVAVSTISAKLEELPPIAKQVYYIVPEKPVQSSRLDSPTTTVRSRAQESIAKGRARVRENLTWERDMLQRWQMSMRKSATAEERLTKYFRISLACAPK